MNSILNRMRLGRKMREILSDKAVDEAENCWYCAWRALLLRAARKWMWLRKLEEKFANKSGGSPDNSGDWGNHSTMMMRLLTCGWIQLECSTLRLYMFCMEAFSMPSKIHVQLPREVFGKFWGEELQRSWKFEHESGSYCALSRKVKNKRYLFWVFILLWKRLLKYVLVSKFHLTLSIFIGFYNQYGYNLNNWNEWMKWNF